MKLNNIYFLKHEVLRKIVERKYSGKLAYAESEIPFEIIPGRKPQFRCCVYKEREIILQRTRLAQGLAPHGQSQKDKMLYVIPAACEGCPISRYRVTENCQHCLAKYCLNACPFGAISVDGNQRASIDQDKCKECGKCAAACPYNAIADLVRPCKKACKIGAIEIDDDRLACIDYEKCIDCGACMKACPFGAISDKSELLGAIDLLQSRKSTYAMLAPSLEGRLGANVSMGKLRAAVKKLGFIDVYETALGADVVSQYEAVELAQRIDNGEKMTSSCCPAFVNYIHGFFLTLANAVSNTVSPMVALSRYIKQNFENAAVVFIGPCIAKKTECERQNIEGGPDLVLTVEVLHAWLDAANIDIEQCEPLEQAASALGRGFCRSGGVTKAILTQSGERANSTLCKQCSGIADAKKELTLLNLGKQTADFLEGMACEGGCVGGSSMLLPSAQSAQANAKLLAQAESIDISERVNTAFADVDLRAHL